MENTMLPSKANPHWECNIVGVYAHADENSSTVNIWGLKINNGPVGKIIGEKVWV